MAFDGNGNFLRIHNWTSDAANNIDINAGEMDGEDNGFAAGLTLCVTRDGQGKMAADLLPSAAGTYNLGTVGLPWLNITSKSGTIGPPSSGVAWTVTGLANNYGLRVIGSSVSGQSIGAQIQAGFTSADYALYIGNQAGTTEFCRVWGDGGITVGIAGTADPGPGIINAQNGVQIGGNPIYAGIPVNTQPNAYQFVLSDANKLVFQTGGGTHTYTIPANATVAFPVGTGITVVNGAGAGALTIAITTDTLVWAANGSTGGRTLGSGGMATMVKVAATTWYISGSQVS
jgi:hypothetical protein